MIFKADRLDMRIKKSEQGFTLVELLVSVGVLVVLSAISVQNYSMYKEMVNDMHAKNDLRNLIMAQEAYHEDNGSYGTCVGMGAGNSLCAGTFGVYGLQTHPKTCLWAIFGYEGYWYGHSISYECPYTCRWGTGQDYFYQSSETTGPGNTWLYGSSPKPNVISKAGMFGAGNAC